MLRTVPLPVTMSPARAWLSASLMAISIGVIDYGTGTDLRVVPLYYAPISLLAWNTGRSGTVAASFAIALVWMVSNFLPGDLGWSTSVWVANTLIVALGLLVVGLLIATLRAALGRERSLSRIDPLTSLRNRRAFFDEGNRILALCRRNRHAVTLAYMDLDNFKAVNDRLGHEAGDNLLRRVADILRASTRPSDLVARFGGDEFAVLLPEADPDEVKVVLQRLRGLVAEAFASATVPVTCSLGAAVFPYAVESMEAMVSAADARMYAAKTGGKNRIHVEIVEPSRQSEER